MCVQCSLRTRFFVFAFPWILLCKYKSIDYKSVWSSRPSNTNSLSHILLHAYLSVVVIEEIVWTKRALIKNWHQVIICCGKVQSTCNGDITDKYQINLLSIRKWARQIKPSHHNNNQAKQWCQRLLPTSTDVSCYLERSLRYFQNWLHMQLSKFSRSNNFLIFSCWKQSFGQKSN